MRGIAVSRAARKADVVVIAARYASQGGKLAEAKSYVRRGPIWGDVVLLDRPTLIREVESGRRVYAGQTKELIGDFENLKPIRLQGKNGTGSLVVEGSTGEADDLGVPLY